MIIKCKKCGKMQSSTATKSRDIFTLVARKGKQGFYCGNCAKDMLFSQHRRC